MKNHEVISKLQNLPMDKEVIIETDSDLLSIGCITCGDDCDFIGIVEGVVEDISIHEKSVNLLESMVNYLRSHVPGKELDTLPNCIYDAVDAAHNKFIYPDSGKTLEEQVGTFFICLAHQHGSDNKKILSKKWRDYIAKTISEIEGD